MTAHRITTDRELAQLRSGFARSQAHAGKLRHQSTRPSVEDVGTRLLNARERVPAGEGKPIPAEVTADNARALHAILNNTPDLAIRALGEQFESCWAAADSIESRWDADNPRHRWIHLLFGAPAADVLRRPADQAAARYANVFGDDRVCCTNR
ncbi:hypothetical protein [Mycobacterium sp. NPDC006124]|uniref:hypothetical protein n=1 Tax=Mycobacterium sp. NPDC006124 TaxID=3156729 RepID=UPI0033AB301A